MAEPNPLKSTDDKPVKPATEKGSIRFIIYDFDQTITKLHLYRELHGGQLTALSKVSDDELISIFGGKERIELLNKHFKFLTDSHIEIGIISFGWSEVIKTSLDRLQLGIYFENKVIIGRDSKEIIVVNRNKGKVIQNLMDQRQLNYDQVLFVDDALSNIERTHKICRTLHVETRCGITLEDMTNIEKQMYVYSQDEWKQMLNEKKNEDKVVNHVKRKSKFDKYKIKSVPKWFEELNKKDEESPVIEIKEDTFSDFNTSAADRDQTKQDVKIATKFTFGNDTEYPQ